MLIIFSVNRKLFLHNIAIACPAISTYVFNCYARPTHLFVFEEYEIRSVEGTTKGDLIAMPIYVIAAVPLLLMVLEILTAFPKNIVKMAAYVEN